MTADAGTAWRAALAGLTTRGRSLLAAGVALAVSAVVLGQRDLMRVAILLVVLPLAAVVTLVRTRYRLSCDRSVTPSRVPVGGSAEVLLRLENVSRLPSGTMLLEDAIPYALGSRPRFVLDRVEPRGVRRVAYAVQSEQRGRYQVGPLRVRLTDPFGLCELLRSFQACESLVVHPVVSPLPPVRLGGTGGTGNDDHRMSGGWGGTDETGIREYRQGDDLRKVHWRSSARAGELMVRPEEPPRAVRTTIVLDRRSSAHRGEGPASSFEWAVSAVASIGIALLRSGNAVQLVDESGTSLVPADVTVTEDVLLDVLAGVELSDAADLAWSPARLGGSAVAVLGRLDPSDAQRLAVIRSRGLASVAVLLDTATWGGGGRRTAEEAPALLRASGWSVLPVRRGTTLAEVWPLAASVEGVPA